MWHTTHSWVLNADRHRARRLASWYRWVKTLIPIKQCHMMGLMQQSLSSLRWGVTCRPLTNKTTTLQGPPSCFDHILKANWQLLWGFQYKRNWLKSNILKGSSTILNAIQLCTFPSSEPFCGSLVLLVQNHNQTAMKLTGPCVVYTYGYRVNRHVQTKIIWYGPGWYGSSYPKRQATLVFRLLVYITKYLPSVGLCFLNEHPGMQRHLDFLCTTNKNNLTSTVTLCLQLNSNQFNRIACGQKILVRYFSNTQLCLNMS